MHYGADKLHEIDEQGETELALWTKQQGKNSLHEHEHHGHFQHPLKRQNQSKRIKKDSSSKKK